MFEHLTERFFQWIHAMPALFTEHGSPNFLLSRTMIGLVLIIAAICVVVLFPYRRMFSSIRRLLTR